MAELHDIQPIPVEAFSASTMLTPVSPEQGPQVRVVGSNASYASQASTPPPMPPPYKGPKPVPPTSWSSSAKDNGIRIWQYLKNTLGLGPVGAAAFIGNFMVESFWTLSPTPPNSKNPPYGIAQWLGWRWTCLHGIYGNEWKLLGNQLSFISDELTGQKFQKKVILYNGTTIRSTMINRYAGYTKASTAYANTAAAALYVQNNYEGATNQQTLQRQWEALFALHELWNY